MSTLMINDLPVHQELDGKTMAAVRGGTSKGLQSPYDWNPFASYAKNDFSFNASQSLDQGQNTLVNNGNNVAFASGITSTVNPKQTGTNTINFI